MDCPAGVLLKGQRFHHHEIATLGFLDVDKLVNALIDSKQVGIAEFANFTFEILPEKSSVIFSLSGLHFDLQPIFETFVMDKTHTARTLAGNNARIVFRAFRAPTETTHNCDAVSAFTCFITLTRLQVFHQSSFF